MTRADRQRQLFEQIVRLRRVERELPGNTDVLTVRTELEDELGPTVTRSTAARFLGLSHTALQRWQASGDLPLVLTPAGRTEVPVGALVVLCEAVRDERRSGRRRRHTLEPVLLEGRRRADLLDPERLLPPGSREHRDRHATAQLRSLVYHRALSERLDRLMVDDARSVLWQWRRRGKVDPRLASQWEHVLDLPLAEIRSILSADTPDARDLRQNSPFAGMLSEPERRKILASVR
jgi:hypothetical protein